MPVVSTFGGLLASLSPVMTAPTFQNFLLIAAGWVFATKRRTITEVIQCAGAVGKKHHSVFHRFFSRARWNLDEVSRVLLGLLLKFVPEGAVVYLATDDTLCRKRGLHIFGTCMHHDPLISCRKVALVNWGHNWVVVGIVLEFPFAPGVFWCLPFAFRLYVSRKRAKSQRWIGPPTPHRTRPELVAEILAKVGKWFPERTFYVLADSAYGGKSVLKGLPENFRLTSRITMDARLFEQAVAPKQRKRGRPRSKGKRLPSPVKLAADTGVKWRKLRLSLYGKRKTVLIKELSGLWRSAGNRPIKVVVVRDPQGKTRDQAFFSTELRLSPREILVGYSRRWSIEVAFENSKSQLGFEDPQNWTRKAVERTAPIAMVLYSFLIAWFAEDGCKHCKFPLRPWYTTKRTPSFADIVATVRKESLREYFLNAPQWTRESTKIIRILTETLRLTG